MAPRRHSPESPKPNRRKNTHPCTWPGCHRLFACPHNVRQHIKEKHTLERPHVCEVCAAAGKTKAFARPFALNRHQRTTHRMEINTDRTHTQCRDWSASLPETPRRDSPIGFQNQMSEQPYPKTEHMFPLLEQQSFESGWPQPGTPAPTVTYGQQFDQMEASGDDHLHVFYHLPTASESSFGSWGQVKATGDAQLGGLPVPADYVYRYPQHPDANFMLGLAAGINAVTSHAWSQEQQSNVGLAWTESPSADATPDLHHSRTNSSISENSPGATMTDDLFSHSPDASSWM